MELLSKLFEVLFPVFLTIGIGYWYGKKDPKFNTKFITTFAGNFGLPAIIFYSLTTTNISIELFLRFSYYITLYVLIFSLRSPVPTWASLADLSLALASAICISNNLALRISMARSLF